MRLPHTLNEQDALFGKFSVRWVHVVSDEPIAWTKKASGFSIDSFTKVLVAEQDRRRVPKSVIGMVLKMVSLVHQHV